MSGTFPGYAEFQNTGTEWLTRVPSHWVSSTLGFECTVKARLGWKGLKAEEYVDSGYIFLATPNIKGKEIDFQDVNYITRERYDESPEIMLQVGDVLVTKDGSTTGTTALVRALPAPATVNSSIAVLRSFGRLDSAYLYYFFSCEYTQHVINRMRDGMGVPHLFQADLRKFFVVRPPLEEQTQIAKFLDYETAKIDQLIDKQQQLIALLKEKRQAVISHAVTKGLNPSAPMKDSGVEWLGQVPAHWDVAPVSTRYSTQLGKMLNEQSSSGPDQFPYLRNANVRWETVDISDLNTMSFSKADRCKFDLMPGDLLVCEGGANIKVVGRTAIWRGEVSDCYYQKALHRLRPTRVGESPEFFMYLMRHMVTLGVFIAESNANTVFHLTGEKLRAHRVPFPPVDEQTGIVSHLATTLGKMDEVARLAYQQVALLQERRTALISAAVTGKIDVRNWHPPEREATQEVA